MTDEIRIFDSPGTRKDSNRLQDSVTTLILWLACAISSVLVSGYFSAFLPGRLKLLGIFPCFLGITTAGLILYWRNMWSCHHLRFLPALSLILGMVCFGWSSYHSFQKYKSIQIQQMKTLHPSLLSLTPNKPTTAAKNEEETDYKVRKSMNEMVNSMKQDMEETSSFASYLEYRVSTLGKWSSPWPELTWGVELLLAGIVSWFFTNRFLAKRIPISQPDE